MKKIACLGWGSLIWDQGTLKTRSGWFEDGPLVRVEFARQSKNGRITLVMVKKADWVRSLWAVMDGDRLEGAIDQLRCREETSRKHIGCWSTGEDSPESIPELSGWARSKDLDAMVWTALGPKFCCEDGRVPTGKEVVRYLREAPLSIRSKAEEYIRKAPRQVATAYRRRIESELAWLPIEEDGT